MWPALRPAALLLALAAASPAAAGAWPRAPGTYFLALRADLGRGGDGDERSLSAYGEYGLTERLTLGAEAGDQSSRWSRRRTGFFARYAAGDLAAPTRFALSLGFSAADDPEEMLPSFRLDAGLHVGRGFASRLGPGWATAAFRVHLPVDGGRAATDLHALLGVRPAPDWMTMLSLGHYRDEDGSYPKLGAALGRRIRGESWGVLHLTQGLDATATTGIGLALWLNF